MTSANSENERGLLRGRLKWHARNVTKRSARCVAPRATPCPRSPMPPEYLKPLSRPSFAVCDEAKDPVLAAKRRTPVLAAPNRAARYVWADMQGGNRTTVDIESWRSYTTTVWTIPIGGGRMDGRRHRQRPAAPPGLWERPEMAQALADRDMGTVLRVFRRWTGASQTDIGMLVGVPQPHVSELERGARKVTTLDLFERFADGLGIPRRLLGLAEISSSDDGIRSDGPVAESQRGWLRTRRFLTAHRPRLTHLVSQIYPESIRLGATGILMSPQVWLSSNGSRKRRVQQSGWAATIRPFYDLSST